MVKKAFQWTLQYVFTIPLCLTIVASQESSRYDGERQLAGLESGGFRPDYPGPYGPNSRPIAPQNFDGARPSRYPNLQASGRPSQGNTGILVGPGGPTGIIGRPNRGNFEPEGNAGIPAWMRNDPRYREYDSCKCSYSFNCPGTSLKFGSCLRGKTYCCFDSRRYPSLVAGNSDRYPDGFYPDPANKYGQNFTPDYHGIPHGHMQQQHQPSYGGNHHFQPDYISHQRPSRPDHPDDFDHVRPHGIDNPFYDVGNLFARSGKDQAGDKDDKKKLKEDSKKER